MKILADRNFFFLMELVKFAVKFIVSMNTEQVAAGGLHLVPG